MTVKRKVIPKLEIHKRGQLVDSFLLNTPRLVIGSAPGAHIRLRSAEVETEHLVIELVNRRFLEAVNVAGDPHLRHQGDAFERVQLGRGSVITLGPLAFKLVFVPRDPEQPRRSADPASIEADTADPERVSSEAPAPQPAPPAPVLAPFAPTSDDITDAGAGVAPAQEVETATETAPVRMETPPARVEAPPPPPEAEPAAPAREAAPTEPDAEDLAPVYLLVYPP
ncbi:MAG: FHA domain-containing protein, partial [Myxococcota bacterium]|nr:FHA domain-containing protein [Myxococcota bacterium]